MKICGECGAPSVDGLGCAEMLAIVNAWEWDDPALGALHFQIVAAFNLQHPSSFDQQAIAVLSAAFIKHMDEALPVSEIRKEMGRHFAGSQRVLIAGPRDDADLRLSPAPTIADVYAGGPVGAVNRVLGWARGVREALDRH